MTKTKTSLAIISLLAIGFGTIQQSEAFEASEIENLLESTEIHKALEVRNEIAYTRSNSVLNANEVIRVPFDTTFVSTTEKYSGLLLISVSGDGKSFAGYQNDAFYIFENAQGNQTTPHNHERFYQLSVGTSSLYDWDQRLTKPNTTIKDFVIYDVDAREIVEAPYVPEYREDHQYTFVIHMDNDEPDFLNFAVGDGIFADNSGAYDIRIVQLAPLG